MVKFKVTGVEIVGEDKEQQARVTLVPVSYAPGLVTSATELRLHVNDPAKFDAFTVGQELALDVAPVAKAAK